MVRSGVIEVFDCMIDHMFNCQMNQCWIFSHEFALNVYMLCLTLQSMFDLRLTDFTKKNDLDKNSTKIRMSEFA